MIKNLRKVLQARSYYDSVIEGISIKCKEVLNKTNRLIDKVKDILSEYLSQEEASIVYASALKWTIRDTYQAMEIIVHNLNTMHCLPANEKVIVKDLEQNKNVTMSIEELYASFKEGKYLIPSLNRKNKAVELKPITHVTKKDNHRRLIKLTTDDYRTVVTTDNHLILTSGPKNTVVDKYPEEVLSVFVSEENSSLAAKSFIFSTVEDNSGEMYVYDLGVKDNENFAVESGIFVHNSRAGAQVPFSSLNYGTDTSTEGRIIIENILKAENAGLGNGETPIFPIHIFKLKSGVNYLPEDPNYDMFELACKVSAKRLFPNFLNLDAPFNAQFYKNGDPNTEVATMGCAYGKEVISWAINNAIFGGFFETFWEKVSALGLEEKTQGNSFYYDLSDVDVKILDSHSGGWVKVLKAIRNKNVKSWYRVSLQSGQEIILTGDHPLPVASSKYHTGRIIVRNLHPGDTILSSGGTEVAILKKEFIRKRDTSFKFSYDVETESDYFDLSGIQSHNCRTRVIGNTYDPERQVTCGRGNLSFTSINLPRLGLKHKGDVKGFFRELDEKIDLVFKQLVQRLGIQSKQHVYNFPFLMEQNVWLDSEKLSLTDKLGDVLKHGTLTIGFIGLAECLKALIGCHQGESEEAQELGLKIVRYFRLKADKESLRQKLNFSVIGTPAEGLCISKGTLVQTIDGSKPIETIKKGDVLFTWNEESHQIEFDTVEKCWMTFKSKKVMKITFDTGQSIICTPNHPFGIRTMRADESNGRFLGEEVRWIKASDLKLGMRVKSNYISAETEHDHYKTSDDQFVHRMAYTFYTGKNIPEGYVIHHVNENPQDNSKENLICISSADHKRLHLKSTIGRYSFKSEDMFGENNPFYGKKHTDESKAKMSASLRRVKEGRHPSNYIDIPEEELCSLYTSGVPVKELCKKYKVTNIVIYDRLKKNNISLVGKKALPIDSNKLLQLYYEGNSLNKISKIMKFSVTKIKTELVKAGAYQSNHVITNIEYLEEPHEVWDIRMKKNHNFYVGGKQGILVHNSGTFVKKDKKLFGIVPGITDREYYTNSFHIPVYFPISAHKKIELEAPYHDFCNGGHITYIELDGDPSKNLDGFMEIVKWMHDLNVGYGSINHPVDRDPVCGYTGIINDVCPRCGRKEGEGIPVEKYKALKRKYLYGDCSCDENPLEDDKIPQVIL